MTAAVALREHVGTAHEIAQHVGLGVEVDVRAAFAVARVEHERGHVGHALLVDEQHVGAVRRERAPARRTRQHAREVEGAHPAERPDAIADGFGGGLADLLHRQPGEAGDRGGLRVRVPLVGRAHHGPARARLGECILERLRVPPLHQPGDVVAGADHRSRPLRQAGERPVEVDPPPVPALVQRDEGVAGGGAHRRHPVELLERESQQRCRRGTHVDPHVLHLARPQLPQVRRRSPARRHGRRRHLAERERRREDRIGADDVLAGGVGRHQRAARRVHAPAACAGGSCGRRRHAGRSGAPPPDTTSELAHALSSSNVSTMRRASNGSSGVGSPPSTPRS